MKKIEALITPSKVDEVKEALAKTGVKSMTFSEVRDYGHHPSRVAKYRGSEYVVDLLPEIKVEVIAEDDEVRGITDTIISVLGTGYLGEGEISIFPMEAVLRTWAGLH
jgi:nitrogen regulatory protein P-II 1